MTWEQFTDVLPIITLILGYAGTRQSDRWKERKDRERDILRRVEDREDAALVELQDVLPTLPVTEADVVNALNEVGNSSEADVKKRYLPVREALTKSHRQEQRARVLASRVRDAELRTTIVDAIGIASVAFTDDEVNALFQRDELLKYDSDEAWNAVRAANEEIGARLRAPDSKRKAVVAADKPRASR
jgi:hypothetical protein